VAAFTRASSVSTGEGRKAAFIIDQVTLLEAMETSGRSSTSPARLALAKKRQVPWSWVVDSRISSTDMGAQREPALLDPRSPKARVVRALVP
jgi:hypothetical protein